MGARGLGPVLLALALALGACKGDADPLAGSGQTATATAELPDDEGEFLALLVPLPGGAAAIEIHYAVAGPAVEGDMSVALGPGGVRRDRWELRSTVGDTHLRASGRRVVTPDRVWTGADGQPGEIRDNHLGGLARAYLARDPKARAAIVEGIETWQRTLDEQRERAGGEQATVLDVACLRTRIAGQNVCMWEQAGVLLEYQGSAFSIDAKQIDRQPELPADTFTLPAISTRATPSEVVAPDYDAVLDEIVGGSYAGLSRLLYANVALPALDGQGEGATEAPGTSPL